MCLEHETVLRRKGVCPERLFFCAVPGRKVPICSAVAVPDTNQCLIRFGVSHTHTLILLNQWEEVARAYLEVEHTEQDAQFENVPKPKDVPKHELRRDRVVEILTEATEMLKKRDIMERLNSLNDDNHVLEGVGSSSGFFGPV